MDSGLCISFYDLLEAGDPIVHAAEGCSHISVKFRLVVFRPFMGEIILGRVLSSDAQGIKLSLGFFDDVIIPVSLLPSPSDFDCLKSIWTWRYYTDGEESVFPIDVGATVGFHTLNIDKALLLLTLIYTSYY